MRIKICGNTDLNQVYALDEMGVEFAGFIFYSGSSRYVVGRIPGEELRRAKLGIQKTGVFVNAGYEEVMQQVKQFGLQMVQLHGDESPMLCERIGKQVPVIKVFRVKKEDDISDRLRNYRGVCEYFLFDTDTAGYGGSGHQFDWGVLDTKTIDKPFFISGGIGVEEVEDLKNWVARSGRNLFAVDINSKVEISPGIKDVEKVKQFVEVWRKG
ncbi:MAG: phosphoribosylanthranilate isomerase [Chitinophagaceae bacterium]|nr:phosphoribosylanthranilate isomerase [Chitinophagaceae bacterium]